MDLAQTIRFRVATPDDAAGVTAVLSASYPVLLAEAYQAELLAALLPLIGTSNPKLLASGTYHLAETDRGEVLACGGWTREEPGTGRITPGVGHVRHFGTHPRFIRMGLGSALLARCIAEAETAGLSQMEARASLNAEPFYRAGGFRTVAHGAERMSGGLAMPVAVMRRTP
jgi:GNAT superfamily N-acetyltransferase